MKLKVAVKERKNSHDFVNYIFSSAELIRKKISHTKRNSNPGENVWDVFYFLLENNNSIFHRTVLLMHTISKLFSITLVTCFYFHLIACIPFCCNELFSLMEA